MTGRLVTDWSRWRIGPVARAMGEVLFPSPCAVCGAIAGPLCDGCRQAMREPLSSRCPRCALAVGPWANLAAGCSWCRGRGLGFDAAVALGSYDGPIRELCLRLKHESQAWRARWAAELIVEACGERIHAYRPNSVVAVPLHWSRRLKRGYNQAQSLAVHLANRLQLPRIPALRRVRATPKLADRSRGERADLLRGAFRSRRGSPVEGQTILLVDDILTTGATCGAAARALKQAGASKVIAVVLGRAEGRT